MEEQLNQDEIKKLLEENLELTREIHDMTKKIKGYITFQKFMSFVYFLIIVVPIVLSIIYLPPLINNLLGQYQSILGGSQGGSIEDMFKGVNPSDIKNLAPELQKLLNQKK